MYATYRFELIRGEDRSIPIRFLYRNPETGRNEAIHLEGYEFLLVVRDAETSEEIDRLSTQNHRIALEGTGLTVNFPHEVTESFTCEKALFDLFILSGKIRQCVLMGEIRVLRGCCYGGSSTRDAAR